MRTIQSSIDKLSRWLAWRLPRVVVRWAFYRVIANATAGRWSRTLVPGLIWETAVKRWEIGDGDCCPTHANYTCNESCDCDDWCCPPAPSTVQLGMTPSGEPPAQQLGQEVE